ncbi:MAG TPA: UDP-2,3-diacylglucosamine diphosphatase LpxI [Terriglobia bacterium]|nr:UDP-2,3-diacylglucosamine diphosphatase LpxI [Terriglobia bacterium]
MSQSQNPRYAVIAGNGHFPFLVLEGAREQGLEPVVIAIQEEAWPELAQKTQSIHWLSLGEIARLMDLLSSERIDKVILAGQVKHVQLFRPIKADQLMCSALASLPRRNTDALIGAFVEMLEGRGIEVLDSTTFLKPLLAGTGLLTRREPEPSERADVEYGREIAKKIAGLDIGQTVVVADRACIAVEAMEGTDAAIERAAKLSNGRRLVVVKVSKPDQDMRFDVPVVGVKTIEVMDRANARVLALDAGKTLLFERDLLLSKANDCGIAIVGMKD